MRGLVRAESHIVLRDGEHEEGTVSSVEAEEALVLEGALSHSLHAHSVFLRVQLHDCLNVLCRVGDGDLEGASDAT